MTKNEIISTIKKVAERHGFITEESNWTRWVEIKELDTHYLNFMITEETDPDTDWTKREATTNLHFRASLASMGGNPTPEDLLEAAEIIRLGALLVRTLEGLKLSYTERW